MSNHDHEVEHLGVGKHLHGVGGDLAAERLITTQQQLLTRLAARVKRAGNLRTAERTIGEQAAVFARKRHTLFNTLIDNLIADFREAINIRFALSKITALYRVVE